VSEAEIIHDAEVIGTELEPVTSGTLFRTDDPVQIIEQASAVADALSRRDFIYLVLFLALFGKSNWFLVLAAAGAPIFFLLLVFLAAREHFQTA